MEPLMSNWFDVLNVLLCKIDINYADTLKFEIHKDVIVILFFLGHLSS